MEKIEIGDATLYHGDCMGILPNLGQVDTVITSPPYGNIREYGGHSVDCLDVIMSISKMLTEGGVCMWNTADQTINGSESGESFRHALHAIDCGLLLHDTMIYCKSGVTFPDSNRYHPAHEYMFVFSNGPPKYFNPLKDWRNKWAGTPIHGTDRQQDGELTKISQNGKTIESHGIRRNWWPISNPYDGGTKGHPAPMPLSMAADHIQTWTTKESIVCDPFAGSGTTGVACMRLGRKFVGIEINRKYFDIACERIEAEHAQGLLF